MAEPMSAERLAEIKVRVEAADGGPWAVDEMLMVESDAGAIGDFYFQPESEAEFAAMKADAVFVAAARTDVPDFLAEVDRLRAKLDAPCGSCHPCTNYADETWRAAGRTPPHVYQWDELNTGLEQLGARMEVLAERYKAAQRIHDIDSTGQSCTTCRTAYPCQTVRTLDGQTGGAK